MQAPYPLARCLLGLARVVLDEGDSRGARTLLDEAMGVAGGGELNHLVASALEALGEVATTEGDVVAAHDMFDEALALARLCQNKTVIAASQHHLGRLARAQGDLENSASLHHQALVLRGQIDDRAGLADSLEALAGLAVVRGGKDRAAHLFGAAQALRDTTGCPRPRLEVEGYAVDVKEVRRGLGPEDFDAEWRRGAGWSLQEALAYAYRRRGSGAQGRDGWPNLTKTERIVAKLVGEGLTNAEIAAQQFVSVRTVETHVRHILGKLGFPSRRHLAREAAHSRGL
jgi:DNA-binding CsgD family transcriptional regulator